MIVGGGAPKFDNHKIFLELYANRNITNGEYKLRIIAQNGSYVETNITSASAGQFIFFQESSQFTNYFGGSFNDTYGAGNWRWQRWSNIDYYRGDNRYEIIRNSDNAVVDRFGDTSTGVSDYPWAGSYSSFKRKDNTYGTSEFNVNDWVICMGC